MIIINVRFVGTDLREAQARIAVATQNGTITKIGDDLYDISKQIEEAAMEILMENREERRRLECDLRMEPY
jgi:cobalamin biosynthesis protein CbiD